MAAVAIAAGPRPLSRSDLAVLLVLVAAIHLSTWVNGRTGEVVAHQRLVLAVLLLVTVYLTMVDRVSGSIGLHPMAWLVPAGVVAVVARVASARGQVRGQRTVVSYTAVDGAMSVLTLMVVMGYLGLYVVSRLNNLPFELQTELLWVVVVATVLNFLFVPLLRDPTELRRGLRISLLLLVPLCGWGLVSQLFLH